MHKIRIKTARRTPTGCTRKNTRQMATIHIARVMIPPDTNTAKWQTITSKLTEQHQKQADPISPEFRQHVKVFSKEAAQQFPEPKMWDHTIELKPGAPATLPRKIYALMQQEREALKEFIKEQLTKGYI